MQWVKEQSGISFLVRKMADEVWHKLEEMKPTGDGTALSCEAPPAEDVDNSHGSAAASSGCRPLHAPLYGHREVPGEGGWSHPRYAKVSVGVWGEEAQALPGQVRRGAAAFEYGLRSVRGLTCKCRMTQDGNGNVLAMNGCA